MTDSKYDADNHSHCGNPLANSRYTLGFRYKMRKKKNYISMV